MLLNVILPAYLISILLFLLMCLLITQSVNKVGDVRAVVGDRPKAVCDSCHRGRAIHNLGMNKVGDGVQAAREADHRRRVWQLG